MLKTFSRSEDGATLVEYGVALILVISLGGSALVALGTQTGANMNFACDELQNVGIVSGNC
jgi:Flp pilus assembly pilin Flp